ncbi:MAG: hypothetical protein OXH03_01985 [Bacteroidetes bacterium]|nr:hypothetical protein [Bacteroidota bacterium]MDE2671913.1 hypothetical protein [Bacteroidota bacterium]
MRKCATAHAIIAVLLAFYVTADVSAQIRFAGDKDGLSVNGKIIETGSLHESLLNVVETLSTTGGTVAFSLFADVAFPARAKINGAMYEIWRDRIVESCDIGNADHQFHVQIRSDSSLLAEPIRRRKKASGPQIDVPLLVNFFKGDDQRTDLFVNYGVPLEPITGRSDRMTAENANISTLLINDHGETLVERTRNFDYSTNQVKAFPDKYLWVDTQQIRMSSDARDLTILQVADGQTTDVRQREIKVPDFDQVGIRLSDIMLAYSVEQTENGIPPSANEIVRKGFSISPAARNVYSTDWPIYLYFEIYGLALGARGRTDYDVEITLEPKNSDRRVRRLFRRNRDRGREGVSVSYRGNGSKPEESLYQILDVSDQNTGPYTLTLSVRDNQTGDESERIQDLILQRWGLSCSE